ncbi:hypothetical protein F0562_031906 [Nyssa sinensis]|uniref:Uncharacterized protein n=1 Tax=Nyssa sinensis TaxID=561372 RepID=A0A5J5AV98_9ASTE|nr:hypothetical protein F0562_031906 [Nyssa sinensis]
MLLPLKSTHRVLGEFQLLHETVKKGILDLQLTRAMPRISPQSAIVAAFGKGTAVVSILLAFKQLHS